jgi:DNA (cytosine-5)-methyltransferase 1
MNKSEEKKIPVLSFYSGGGFLDMGFEMAGFEIVWTNEFDQVFTKLHAAGITSWRKSKGNGIKAEIFNTQSINDISSKQIIKEAFPDGKPKVFGMIGGPPCQDFSLNGNQDGFEGDRGKLTILYFDKILELKPAFFVMENVTGLTKGKSSREHLAKLLKRVEKYYYIDHDTLNALNFGVPQFRERVFFVGIRKNKLAEKEIKIDISGKWFSWPVEPEYKDAETKYKWPQAIEFGGHITIPPGLPLELCVESCLVPSELEASLPNSKEYFNLYIDIEKLNQIKEGETNRPSFKRLHRYKYSPTACYGNNEVHLHPYLNRRLSVRETLRIQGVPDTYVLPPELPLSKKFKMIGNGVPIPMAKALGLALRAYISNKKIK